MYSPIYWWVHFYIKKQERSRTMEALWFVLGFVVTTTVVLATEKLIIKN